MGKDGNANIRFLPLVSAIFYVMLGPVIWALDFAIIYGAHATLCAPGVFVRLPRDANLISFSLLATTAGAFLVLSAAISIFTVRRLRQPRTFLDSLTEPLAFLSLIGVVWLSITLLIVDPCLQLR